MAVYGKCIACGASRRVARIENRDSTLCRQCRIELVARRCRHCSARVPSNTDRRYCDACVAAQVWLTGPPSRYRRACALCGVSRMTSPGSLPEGQYICHPCRRTDEKHRAAIAAKRRLREAGRGDFRERARRYGVEYEPVDRYKVYARDKWTCGICRRKVSRTCVYPDPLSPSLDHVVPMSKGGGHTYANTQCSHLICNVRKGDRGAGGEQLALVG